MEENLDGYNAIHPYPYHPYHSGSYQLWGIFNVIRYQDANIILYKLSYDEMKKKKYSKKSQRQNVFINFKEFLTITFNFFGQILTNIAKILEIKIDENMIINRD